MSWDPQYQAPIPFKPHSKLDQHHPTSRSSAHVSCPAQKKTTTKTHTFNIRILFQHFSFLVSNLNNLFQSTVSAQDLEFQTSIPPIAPSCARRSAGLNCKNFTKYICNYDMYLVVYTDDCVYIHIYIYCTYVYMLYAKVLQRCLHFVN